MENAKKFQDHTRPPWYKSPKKAIKIRLKPQLIPPTQDEIKDTKLHQAQPFILDQIKCCALYHTPGQFHIWYLVSCWQWVSLLLLSFPHNLLLQSILMYPVFLYVLHFTFNQSILLFIFPLSHLSKPVSASSKSSATSINLSSIMLIYLRV